MRVWFIDFHEYRAVAYIWSTLCSSFYCSSSSSFVIHVSEYEDGKIEFAIRLQIYNDIIQEYSIVAVGVVLVGAVFHF